MDEGGSNVDLTFYRGRFLPTSKVTRISTVVTLLELFCTIVILTILYIQYEQGRLIFGWMKNDSVPFVAKYILMAGIPASLILLGYSIRYKIYLETIVTFLFIYVIGIYLWG